MTLASAMISPIGFKKSAATWIERGRTGLLPGTSRCSSERNQALSFLPCSAISVSAKDGVLGISSARYHSAEDAPRKDRERNSTQTESCGCVNIPRFYLGGYTILGNGGVVVKRDVQRKVLYALRISITPVGTKRTEAQLRIAVLEAHAAALQEFRQRSELKEADAVAEAEGGFLGLGVEWIWVYALLAPVAGEVAKSFASGAAKKMGEELGEGLVALFLRELRKRNLIPGKTMPAPEITSVAAPPANQQRTPAKHSRKAKTAKRKPKRVS